MSVRSAANRERLKEFYKSKAREDAELVRNPEINLDSSQFNKDAYVSKILRNLPLASLLGSVCKPQNALNLYLKNTHVKKYLKTHEDQEKSVGKEICELDHNMQSLVYDNYNKVFTMYQS